MRGHAIECRINAEDPNTFMPSPGPHHACGTRPAAPACASTRTSTPNYIVPPNYDSMIGKIIVHGDTREQAIARMRIALSEMVVEGIKTNIPLHRELMVDAEFMDGGTNIHYLEELAGAAQALSGPACATCAAAWLPGAEDRVEAVSDALLDALDALLSVSVEDADAQTACRAGAVRRARACRRPRKAGSARW